MKIYPKPVQTQADNNSGFVVPIDVEALCIGKDPGSIFEQTPFDFEKLKNPPYLSGEITNTSLSNLPGGVHLHWALPDSIAQGRQDLGKLIFPAVPDRWLITRVFTDTQSGTNPRFERWIVESNYHSKNNPNPGPSTTVIPFQGQGWKDQPWRHLGKVSRFETWLSENAQLKKGAAEEYVSGLSAVGYGVPDFAASYHNVRNVLGFHDKGTDLEKLGTDPDANKYVSYHIIGWYSNPAEDPIRQIPASIHGDAFNEMLNKITNPADKNFVTASFTITVYSLSEDVTQRAGDDLWDILRRADYPLEVDIPVDITAKNFDLVLEKTPDPNDRALLKKWYLPAYGPVPELTDEEKDRLWDIMASAGFDFVNALLVRAKWALPSGTAIPEVSPGFTVYSGMICNVRWNRKEDYFEKKPGTDFNVAIGNTAGQALSALAANTSGYDPKDIPMIEEILDALQTGLLDRVKDESIFEDWVELRSTLHQGTFGSQRGGLLYEVRLTKETADSPAEVTLPDHLAEMLNDLNTEQQKANEFNDRLQTMRAQVFGDWYRFMEVFHKGDGGRGIQAGNLAEYIGERINLVNELEDEIKEVVANVHSKEVALRSELGASMFLTTVTAPRYWQPNDPVLLFQGDGIDPSDRFGNDGRYMSDDTLVCRLGNQLISALTIPAGAFGNTAEVKINTSIFPVVPNPDKLRVLDCINKVTIDAGLLNEDIIAQELRKAGVTTELPALAKETGQVLQQFLEPRVPEKIPATEFDTIAAHIAPADATFLKSMYTKTGEEYVLRINPEPTASEELRIIYILISTGSNTVKGKLDYTGIAFSQVGLQAWDHNPWLPFTMKWTVNYFPLLTIKKENDTYPEDFITSQFRIGTTDLEYTKSATPSDLAHYTNTIFLTPHANINLRKQLEKFIDHYPYDDQLKKDLEKILSKLSGKPVLAQAMSGLNEAFLMLQKILQLPVGDPASSEQYNNFSNTIVPNAVLTQNTDRPLPEKNYNPLRVGLIRIDEIVLIDVFGRNVKVQPQRIYRSQDMIQERMQPAINIYLAPRLTQATRLQFRWLSANTDQVEMNSHPATTPICGWVLANHLDLSLWVYDNKGNPYGSFILNFDRSRIIWQCAPGSPYFGLSLDAFLKRLGEDVVNAHLEKFMRALYGDDLAASAAYLDAFLKGLDDAALTIEPGNYQQFQSNAVLMGRPYALVRASIDLQLMGDPAYNQSWENLKTAVDTFAEGGPFIPGNDRAFTKVKFPVKIGNIPQTEDGLAGYFKGDDYGTFYCPAVVKPTDHVLRPGDNNLLVTTERGTAPLIISMLVEPRGRIHASTGILPVKSIEIPPDQYLDALQRLQLSFLTAPVLTPRDQLSMPVPSVTGGFWTWIENEGNKWSGGKSIEPVIVNGVMNYGVQYIQEGWLNLSSRVLNMGNFSLRNVDTPLKAPVLYITNDPSKNNMKFRIINKTGMPLKLAGGEPVYGSLQEGGSSFAFNFGEILPDTILSKMVVKTDWHFRYFERTENNPAAWVVSPKEDMTMKPDEEIIFGLENITCPEGTLPGNFTIRYFNLPEVPDSIATVLIPVNVLPVKNLLNV